MFVMGSKVPARGKCFNYLRGKWTRSDPLLKTWRTRRRLSQLDLALEADVSTRHLSFVETGRSRPSEQMVLHLAEQLDVPLRERNRMLLAAGLRAGLLAAHARRARAGADQGRARPAARRPRAVPGDRGRPRVEPRRRQRARSRCSPQGVAPHLLEPPVNVLRLALHPEGMAPRITNLGEWRAHLLRDLAAQVDDERRRRARRALRRSSRRYPGPDGEPARARRLRPARSIDGLELAS